MDNTNAERQRRYIARLKAAAAQPEVLKQLAQARQRIAQLEHELAQAKARPKKPPLPPDEARKRTIKGLRTRVRNLEAALQMVAGMPRATQNAIFNALHPDRKLSAAERAA